MAGNTFGKLFKLTSFGESHGVAIGGVVDGCPPGIEIDMAFIQNELNRRKPGQSEFTTSRDEKDEVEFLSGIFEGKSTGTPIGFLIRNKDSKSKDYDQLKDVYRPSHADFSYEKKYGVRDHRGGGRSSARETSARVVAGAIAKLFLRKHDIEIIAFVSQIGPHRIENELEELSAKSIEDSLVRCPDPASSAKMQTYLQELKESGDSAGGIISCMIENTPAGIGEPVFDKLHADLGKSMLSINAVKGFEYGFGFESAAMKASEMNDSFVKTDEGIRTETNFSGGIQGGISNGESIYFNVAFKPVASISSSQKTVNKSGEEVNLKIEGRHDPCVVPRAVPIVEAMAAIVMADHFLRQKAYTDL